MRWYRLSPGMTGTGWSKRGCFLALMLSALLGCSSKSRLSTFLFDGIPYPLAEVCAEYCKPPSPSQSEAAEPLPQATQASAPKEGGSRHDPYESKRCDDCHDKTKEDGLILPKRKLCIHCHERFQGAFVHGPVAVGDCLACHLPHSSYHPSLLAAAPRELCFNCHQEKRVAARLHEKAAKQMLCFDCHDPHAGEAAFFLK